MKIKLLVVSFIAAFASLAAHADLFWYNNFAVLDENGDPVTASETDHTVGYFAQLIFAGASPDAFVASGNGTSGDDAVIETMFSGQNDFLYVDGFFPIQAVAAVLGSGGNGDYYVRVFNAPNPDFYDGTSAEIPASATHYWQSDVHTYTHSDTLPDTWDFAPSGGQTLTVIVPEPSVLAIMGLGLFGLASARRRFQA